MASIASSPPFQQPSSPVHVDTSSPINHHNHELPPPEPEQEDEQPLRPPQPEAEPQIDSKPKPKPKTKPKPKSKAPIKKKRKSKVPEAELDDEIGDLLGEEEDQLEEDNDAGPSVLPNNNNSSSSSSKKNKQSKKIKQERLNDNNGDEEIDELMEDENDRTNTLEGEGEVGENNGEFKCEWGQCDEVSGTHNGLIEHVKDDHINTLKDFFICEWYNCPRTGQKQASRHSLSTHMRMHTGERPYACQHQGCSKSFTRSDALQKHIKSQHSEKPITAAKPTPNQSTPQTTTNNSNNNNSKAKGKSKSRHPPIVTSTPLTRQPLNGPPQTDEDLLLDEDLAEVLPKIRKRELLVPSIEEIEALSYLRSIFPRQNLSLNSTNPLEIDHNLDDPPIELNIPEESQLIQTIQDPDIPQGELDLLGRSQWQAKYIMIKARLMLVEEENTMRRMELIQLLQQEVV
ncbi:uncharacterized protein L201_006735 [Kwoniella dendrophila CBS 6074]|uniref:C2H2-type domain-containing protein n=1 Tax=Kwoniella dendrophila CBS 6074 TaxID=1295534 RepID=A0AAX4K3X1_9TREE